MKKYLRYFSMYSYLNINVNVFDPMSGWNKHRMVVDLDRFTVCT